MSGVLLVLFYVNSREVHDRLEVLAMPTFILFQNGEKKAHVVEPKPDELLAIIEKSITPGP